MTHFTDCPLCGQAHHRDRWCRPRAADIIWDPDDHPLEVVAEAAEMVLSRPGAPSLDAHQAAYLLTSMRPR